MKIGLLIEQLDILKGGQERSTLEIAERLRARGLSVSILTGIAENIPPECGVDIIDLGLPRYAGVSRYLGFIRASRRWAQKEKFDLVHAVTPVPFADIYQPRGGLIQETFDRNLARRRGFARLVRYLVGPNFRQRMVRRVERRLARESNCHFLAVSDYVREQCFRHLNLPEERVHTIFNGVDLNRLPESFHPAKRSHMRSILRIGENQLVGVFVAANFKLKGLNVIVETADLMRKTRPDLFSRFKFLVSGPDKVRPFFNKILKMGLDDSFVFLGPTKDIAGLFHTADFLVHPTWYDPCSRVVLEAMACGLPAVSTRFNGAGELLRRAEGGFIVQNPGDPRELMEFMIRFLEPGLPEKLGQNARAFRNRISMEHHVDQLVEFYEKIRSSTC